MTEHAHHHHHVDFDAPEVAAFAELEAEVLAGLLTQATSVLAARCRTHGVAVRRVLDLGCGPGVGTCHLAERFGSATVVAADGSATMLEHAAARSERLGLSDRVEVRQVELPDGLGTLGRADVAWASMALHHVGDEVDALRRLREVLEPGGLLALVEHAGPIRVLDDDTSPLWERLEAASEAWFAEMRAGLPGFTPSAGYPDMLREAGFEVVADELLVLVLDPPLDARAGRFAREQLRRTAERLESHAEPADLEALAALADDLPDAPLRARRHLYVARATEGGR